MSERKIVRVPPGFQHPTDSRGFPIPGAHDEILSKLSAEQLTGFQIYECTSEGTPITQVFDSEEEFCNWLISRGVAPKDTAGYIEWGYVDPCLVPPVERKQPPLINLRELFWPMVVIIIILFGLALPWLFPEKFPQLPKNVPVQDLPPKGR